MALDANGLKAKMKTTIYNGLKKEFGPTVQKGSGYTEAADIYWKKMAEAISGIAADIVTEILTNAMVVPGQSVVGAGGGVPGPVTGATTTPGTIM